MAKARRSPPRRPPDEGVLAGKRRAPAPHEFVLDAMARLGPTTRPMFGCLAVYVAERIIFILRDRPTETQDNGVWLATTAEHHASLLSEFPHMRSIQLFRRGVTDWQVLPIDAPDFEASSLRACALVIAGDPRIGKIPKRRTIGRPRKSGRRKVARRG
jgi:hypothetical protein